MHVTVLHRALGVYVLPEAGVQARTAAAAAANTAIAPATGINFAALARAHKDAGAVPEHGIAAGLGAMMFGQQ